MSRLQEAALALWKERPAVLVAVAHPDDAEIRFGATMLRLADEGKRVYILVATKGEKSCADTGISDAAVARVRRREQEEAARLAGVKGVIFLGFPDGGLEARKEKLRERITFHIRRLKPEVLYTYDPTTVYFEQDAYPHMTGPVNHPDHRAVGDAALQALHCSGMHRYYPAQLRRGLEPWAVSEVFLNATSRPNHPVDIKPYLERKRALIMVYRSQEGERLQMLGLEKGEQEFRRLDCRGPRR